MKKILLVLILLSFCLPIFAQIDLGIKAGINSEKFSTKTITGGDSYSFSDLKADFGRGYHVGLFARIGRKVYFQPELLYTEKKSTSDLILNIDGADVNSRQSFDIQSVQVPLLLGFRLINLKVASVRIFTGPAMSVNLDESRIKFSASDGFDIDPSVYDPKYIKNNVWDWQAGGGVDIGPLVLDIRYEWGISNLSEANPAKLSFTNKGNTLTLSAGFKFF